MLSERSQKCPEEAKPFLKSTSVDARGWMEGGRGSDCLMDMGFLWGADEKVLELDGGDGCTILY